MRLNTIDDFERNKNPLEGLTVLFERFGGLLESLESQENQMQTNIIEN